jgi:hypothetical protein
MLFDIAYLLCGTVQNCGKLCSLQQKTGFAVKCCGSSVTLFEITCLLCETVRNFANCGKPYSLWEKTGFADAYLGNNCRMIRDRPLVTNQVSLSACGDLQRAWEGPQGSLTVLLCEFLSKPVFCSNLAFFALRREISD